MPALVTIPDTASGVSGRTAAEAIGRIRYEHPPGIDAAQKLVFAAAKQGPLERRRSRLARQAKNDQSAFSKDSKTKSASFVDLKLIL